MTNKILLITEGDPWGVSKGGQTTFAKHLIRTFNSRIAVSSHCSDNTIPIGIWVERNYEGNLIWFFSRGTINGSKDKSPFVPSRIQSFFLVKKYIFKIREIGISNLFIDSPQMLFAITKYKWTSICYRFAGVNNPVSNSRYVWARVLGQIFEKYYINTLVKVKPDVIIAAADHDSIKEFHLRTKNRINNSKFFQFPTRVDTNLFYPIAQKDARRTLNLPEDIRIFVTTGRLCWIKGWDLLLESFHNLKEKFVNALLVFVGDGEDRNLIENKAISLGIESSILITGFIHQSNVVMYMNAADVCLVGSYLEGWSLAMCEMIACGKPVVTTNVSGARDMIKEGENGYVVNNREISDYALAVENALNLKDVKNQSLEIVKKYSLNNLAQDLEQLWKPLSQDSL